MVDTVKLALISATGTGVKRMLPAIADSAVCEAVALHGRDIASLEAAAGSFGVGTILDSLDEVTTRVEVDAAIVCSPPFVHLEQTASLLEQRIPVLVEKPLSLSADECSQLDELAKANSCLLAVGHHLRFQPALEVVRGLMHDGSIGEVHRAGLEWSFRMKIDAKSSKWKTDYTLGGTALADAGSHCVDMALHLFGGGEVVAAICREGLTGDPYGDVQVLSRHGTAVVDIVASRKAGPYFNSLRITGSDGEMIVPLFFSEASATEVVIKRASDVERIPLESVDLYRAEIEHFCLALGNGEETKPLASAADATKGADFISEALNRLVVI